jgi:hypothetical protein
MRDIDDARADTHLPGVQAKCGPCSLNQVARCGAVGQVGAASDHELFTAKDAAHVANPAPAEAADVTADFPEERFIPLVATVENIGGEISSPADAQLALNPDHVITSEPEAAALIAADLTSVETTGSIQLRPEAARSALNR